MDGFTHPVGEQPAAVYWKRRAFVVAGIVVLALFLWWALSSLGGNSPTPGASGSPDPSTSGSPDATVAVDPSRVCSDADFTAATAVPAQVSGSKKASFTVTLTSTASTPCVIDASEASKLIIKSGNDTWFDSSTCDNYVTFDAEPFMLDAGATHELKTSWNYGRDAKGCSADLQKATKGFYWATATVAGVAADKQQFEVTG